MLILHFFALRAHQRQRSAQGPSSRPYLQSLWPPEGNARRSLGDLPRELASEIPGELAEGDRRPSEHLMDVVMDLRGTPLAHTSEEVEDQVRVVVRRALGDQLPPVGLGRNVLIDEALACGLA